MAVREGFEPSILAYTHFPGVLLRPLGHLTVLFITDNTILTSTVNGFLYARGRLAIGENSFKAVFTSARLRRFATCPNRYRNLSDTSPKRGANVSETRLDSNQMAGALA